MKALLAATCLTLLAGVFGSCLYSQEFCVSDADCGTLLCARNGECAAELVSVRLRWTIDGQPPSPAVCDDIAELSIVFQDRGAGGDVIYEPVPCRLGQIFYDRMPARFDAVTVRAHGSGGRVRAAATVQIQMSEITKEIDLRLQ